MNSFNKNDDEYKFLFLLFKSQAREFIRISFLPGLENRERLEQVFFSPQNELEYEISKRILYICLNINNTEKYITDSSLFNPLESKSYSYILSYIYMMYQYSQIPEVEKTLIKPFNPLDEKELEQMNLAANMICSSVTTSNEMILQNMGIDTEEKYFDICSEANLIWLYHVDSLVYGLKQNPLIGPIINYGDPQADELTGDLLISALESLTYKEELIVEGKEEDIIKKENEKVLKFLNHFDEYMGKIRKRKIDD